VGKKNRIKMRDKLKRYEPLLAKMPEEFRGIPMSVDDPVGGVKISEVLLNYLEPYTEGLEGEDLWNKVLGIGVIAWNAALLPSNTLKEALEGAMETLPVPERQKVIAILEEMVQRKKRFFAHDRRFIIEYHLRIGIDGPFLSVVSSSDVTGT
jgi:hypothetical protein